MKELTFILALFCTVAILIIGMKYGITYQRITALEARVTTLETDIKVIEQNIVVITKAMDHNFKFISGTLEGHLDEIIRLEDKANEQ